MKHDNCRLARPSSAQPSLVVHAKGLVLRLNIQESQVNLKRDVSDSDWDAIKVLGHEGHDPINHAARTPAS